jgi:hypothetical protein
MNTTHQFEFEVIAPAIDQHQTFLATVRIPLKAAPDAPRILSYLRSAQMKHDLLGTWARANAPGYGLSSKGGPRPVFKAENDRSSDVVAYELDFQFTKSI